MQAQQQHKSTVSRKVHFHKDPPEAESGGTLVPYVWQAFAKASREIWYYAHTSRVVQLRQVGYSHLVGLCTGQYWCCKIQHDFNHKPLQYLPMIHSIGHASLRLCRTSYFDDLSPVYSYCQDCPGPCSWVKSLLSLVCCGKIQCCTPTDILSETLRCECRNSPRTTTCETGCMRPLK